MATSRMYLTNAQVDLLAGIPSPPCQHVGAGLQNFGRTVDLDRESRLRMAAQCRQRFVHAMSLAAVPKRPENQVGRYAIFDGIAACGMASVHLASARPRGPGAAAIRLVAMVASVGAAACTYNFDKFAAQDAHVVADGSPGGAGGTAGSGTQYGESGGKTSATGGVAGATSKTGGAASGGVAGIAATGGQAGAASGGAAAGGRPGTDAGVADAGVADAGADASTGSCVGPARSGICWYLGPLGSSCQKVCASHGQPAPEAATHVGTASQGGSLSECGILLGLLSVSGAPANGTRSDGLGLGCHVYNTSPWWLSSPNFSVSASHASAKLVCGCTQ